MIEESTTKPTEEASPEYQKGLNEIAERLAELFIVQIEESIARSATIKSKSGLHFKSRRKT